MMKKVALFILSLAFITSAYAQKGGVIYYLTNSGKLVSTKDSADYSMVVMPPDSSVDKNLYVVYEYDKNGKVRLVTNSATNDLNLLYQGDYVAYFSNGKKRKIGKFQYGQPSGRELSYYPNGKLYQVKNYLPGNRVFFSDSKDSTGSVLAENGSGKWVEYDEDFLTVQSSGQIENGAEEGEWVSDLNKYEYFKAVYHDGRLQSGISIYKPGIDTAIYRGKVSQPPGFLPEMKAFYKFLSKNIRYPALARENNVQGKVIVGVTIEKDGTVTGVKVEKGIGYTCDEECERVMRISPPWTPAYDDNGKPVRTKYSVPVSFAISQ